MGDKTLESELMACKEELKEANEQIEYLKYELEKKEKNHKWEIREINKRIEQATDKNLELYDRESKALIYADQLEKDKNILVKEKREHEKKIEKALETILNGEYLKQQGKIRKQNNPIRKRRLKRCLFCIP